jgi:hypothetical protein
MASPKPQSSGRPASIKGGHVDSPLRNEAGQEVNDQGEVIHIDPPAHRLDKVHGGGYDPPTEDLGPEGGNTSKQGGWVTERGYGTPILASDELKKHPHAEWRQPAVSPELERHGNEYTVNEDGTPQYITKRTHSRSSSRNNNAQQRVVPSPAHLERGSTPLESHKEYEPLFPEDEDETKKPKSQVDKLKRPTVARHHFPSQDVWEDTPGSLQLETTVDTPQEPEEPRTAGGNEEASPAKVFEDPETEEQRKNNITKEDQKSFLPEHTRQFAAENKLLGKVRGEEPLRPGMQQRFPSQDVWEDAPSHGHLETTVSAPQAEDTNEYIEESPVDAKPPVPARPSIPARPARKESSEASPVDKKAPIIPERPKPQIPARPSKPSTGSSENVPTMESQSGENNAPQAKAKPPVPARPSGSKLAALKAGFLNDLNSKIAVGPHAPPKVQEPEPEEEAAPLSDVRKSRAKGPQRRKPASSPSPNPAPAATVTAEVAVPRQQLEIAPVTAIWSFGEDGSLNVPAAEMAAKIQQSLAAPAKSEQPEAPKDVTEKSVGPETKESEPLQPEAREPEPMQTETKEPEPVQPTKEEKNEPTSTAELAADRVVSTASAAADKISSLLSPVTSQASESLEQAKSQASSTLEQEKPLVTETVPGSSDIPGAFPGSGPDLDNKADVGFTGGESSQEQKLAEDKSVSSTMSGEQRDVETSAPAPATTTTTTTTEKEKEGAGYSQTFAG